MARSLPEGTDGGAAGRVLLAAAEEARHVGPERVVHEVLDSTGSPSEGLIRAAAHTRLLVIGLRGQGGVRKGAGGIAEKVLQRLPCRRSLPAR
jgi:nucleotide-binding universal stress UspA family protein